MDSKEVQRWQDQINQSLLYRKPREDVWKRVHAYLQGQYFEDSNKELDEISVNMVHTHARVVVPAIYSRNPEVIVTPQRSDIRQEAILTKRAEVTHRLLKYLMKEMKIKNSVKLAILDAVLFGIGYIKLGYETEFAEMDGSEQDTPTVIQRLLSKLGIKSSSPGSEDDTDDLLNIKITREQPWALRVSPFNIITPAVTSTPDQLWWIAERLILPHRLVTSMDEYDTDGLKPAWTLKDIFKTMPGYEATSNTSVGDDDEYDVLYEIYDPYEKQLITIADGYDKPLQVKDFEFTFLDSKFHPYVELRFNEIPDKYVPAGDIEPAEAQQLELNDIRTKESRHTKRYNRRYVTKPGAFSTTSKEKLIEGEDGTIVEAEQTYADTPIGELIEPIIDAPLPPDVYAYEGRVMETLLNILGTNDYAAKAGNTKTATEASILAAQSRVRVEERIDLVNDFIQCIITGIMQMCMKLMSPDQVSNIVGTDGMYWQQCDDDDEIRKMLYFDIVYGSTLPINRDVDREQYSKFFMLTRNDPYFDQVKIRQELCLRYDLSDPESFMDPKIVEMLEEQRKEAIQAGMALPSLMNASGAPDDAGRVPDLGKRGSSLSGDPSDAGDDLGDGPEIPGGLGGTAMVPNPIGM